MDPLPGSERSKGISGMVEGTEGTGEKEGKRNLEYQLGYQSATKGVMKTLGWKVLTDKMNAVYKSQRRVTVMGNNYP